jgi:hypothetical protein
MYFYTLLFGIILGIIICKINILDYFNIFNKFIENN